jgi:ABC-type histidine transport system ATPase subunit
MDKWFKLYKEVIKSGSIESPRRIWNMDESGIQDVPRKRSVVGPRSGKAVSIVPSEKGETSTVLCCVNAAGETTNTCVIFKGVRIQTRWLEGKPDDVDVKASPKGYINKQLIFGVWDVIH